MNGFKGDLISCKDTEIYKNATEYKYKLLGDMFILVYDKILLLCEDLKVSLIPPNQVREAGNTVDDITKYFTKGTLLHGTHISKARLTIPFKLRAIVLYYTIRMMK